MTLNEQFSKNIPLCFLSLNFETICIFLVKEMVKVEDSTLSSSSDEEVVSDNDNTNECELEVENELDYASDESTSVYGSDPEWNLFEEAAENEESGNDEENSDTPVSRNDVR